VAGNNESTKPAIGRHAPQCVQRRERDAYDDRPCGHDDEADCKEGERRDRHAADHPAHRGVRGGLNRNERADYHGERTQQHEAQGRHQTVPASRRPSLAAMVTNSGRESAFIACTLIGTSPWPVMKMIGMSVRSTSRCCSSSPLSPGSVTSSTRQHGTVGRGRDWNSRADANVSGCQPAALIKSSSESRTETSSSTTKTMDVTSDI